MVRVEDVIIGQKDKHVCYFQDDYIKTFAHDKCGRHHKELLTTPTDKAKGRKTLVETFCLHA